MADPVVTAYAELARACDTVVQAAARVRTAIAREARIHPGPAGGPIATIQAVVERRYGFTHEAMLSSKRTAHLALARQVAMWLCRSLTPSSLEVIGDAFCRDHGTVIHAIRAVGNRSATDPKFASELLDVRALCEEALKTPTK